MNIVRSRQVYRIRHRQYFDHTLSNKKVLSLYVQFNFGSGVQEWIGIFETAAAICTSKCSTTSHFSLLTDLTLLLLFDNDLKLLLLLELVY